MKIDTWPIDKLVAYARNPRKNDTVVERMRGSLKRYGFKIPCSVRSDGEAVAGHLRLKAAHKLVERWKAFSGKNAILEGDERTFEAIAQDRMRWAA